jgi:hypothetical protein
MNSSMIVTPPLPAEVWEAVGWNGCETVSDAAHAYAYLQRTADDRIAIGGRGVPYRYGSRLEGVGQTAPPTGSGLRAALIELLPAGSEPWVQVDQAWSGVLGVARDWCPSVGIARSEGSPDGGLGGGLRRRRRHHVPPRRAGSGRPDPRAGDRADNPSLDRPPGPGLGP